MGENHREELDETMARRYSMSGRTEKNRKAVPVHPLGRQIKMAANLIGRRIGAIPAVYDGENLTMMQRITVGILYDYAQAGQDVFQRDLEREFSIRRSTATGLLQLMEKKGLIVREAVPYDARLKRLRLTSAAVQLNDEIRRGLHEMEVQLARGLSGEEIAELHRLLDIVAKNAAL